MNDLFKVYLLNQTGIERAKEMATRFSDIVSWVETVGLSGREMAIFKTQIETACFFAKKSLAMKPENQKEE